MDNCARPILAGLSRESQATYWFPWAQRGNFEKRRAHAECLNSCALGELGSQLYSIPLSLTQTKDSRASTVRSQLESIRYMNPIDGKPYFTPYVVRVIALIIGIAMVGEVNAERPIALELAGRMRIHMATGGDVDSPSSFGAAVLDFFSS